MVLRILCIGDVGNVVKTISRFSKSAIHIIVWPKADAGIYTYDDEYEIFQNLAKMLKLYFFRLFYWILRKILNEDFWRNFEKIKISQYN